MIFVVVEDMLFDFLLRDFRCKVDGQYISMDVGILFQFSLYLLGFERRKILKGWDVYGFWGFCGFCDFCILVLGVLYIDD